MVLKVKHSIPVQEGYKKFCDYMGYELVDKKGGWYYYHIPPGHICRFKVNYEKWLKGIFNKKDFIKNIK